MRCTSLALAGAAMLVTSLAPAASPDRQAVYQSYLDFPTLVDQCKPEFSWSDRGRAMRYTRLDASGRAMLRLDPMTGTETPLFDVARLRAALATDLGHQPLEAGVPFADVSLDDAGHASFELEGHRYSLDLASYELRRLPPPDPAEDFLELSARLRQTPKSFKREFYMSGEIPQDEVGSPDGRWFASLRNYDIWLRSTLDGRSTQLTTGGTRDIAWDFETWERNPWSPDGQKLFAAHIDRSAVFRVPQVHFLKRDEELDMVRLQKAGQPIDKFDLFILSSLGAAPLHIDIGDTTDQYFRLLGWRPDGSEVLFARFDRLFTRVDILAANALSGSVRTVMSESSPTFVRLQHFVLWGGDVGFTLLPDGQRFLWQSERDGWNHLYLYNIDGKLVRKLTDGELVTRNVLAADAGDGYTYFTARGGARPYDTHFYRVPLAGGRVQRLTEGDGEHEIRFAPAHQFFVDTHSTVAQAPATEIRAVDGKLLKVFAKADISKLTQLGWTAPEEFKVTAADGKTELWGVLYKPYDFDPARSYPLVEYVYGGPQAILAPKTFCTPGAHAQQFPRALAQLGYIVMILDARGTPGRSKAFQDVVYREWATHVVADHAGAIRQLAAGRSWINLERVGIFGRSWGGYFAFRALADQPDLYKAAVSIVPGFDPYNGILYEPFLGLPQANAPTYAAADVFGLAPRVRGALMMAGGTLDTSTYTDIMKMSAALIDADKPYDLLILPNQEHQQVGHAADYLSDAIARFFERHVPPSASAAP